MTTNKGNKLNKITIGTSKKNLIKTGNDIIGTIKGIIFLDLFDRYCFSPQ